MGSSFYRVKIGLYVLIVLIVGTLFGVRVYNTLQKTNYSTEPVFQNGDIQIFLHYPVKIFSARNDALYPLIVSFRYLGNASVPHDYEVSFRSSTLLFVDAKGMEIVPHFQFASSDLFVERIVYVRPVLSEIYPQEHWIVQRVSVDKQLTKNQPAPIEIQTEAQWFSFFSLAAASLLEMSIVSALIVWITYALDTALISRKERVAKIRETLAGLPSLPYLEQMDRVCKLQEEIKNEHLDGEVGKEIVEFKGQFKESEFFRALGEQLRQDNTPSFLEIENIYNCFFPAKQYIERIDVLGEILDQPFNQANTLSAMDTVMLLWDEFDVDSKDLIIGVMRRLVQKTDFASIPVAELLKQVFGDPNRRRLLRDVEIKALFPNPNFLPPIGYNAKWLQTPTLPPQPRVIDWLKQHELAVNPFGAGDLKNCPFYPEGSALPDNWTAFLTPVSHLAKCPTPEDARMLAFRLRAECFPLKISSAEGQTADSKKQAFPVLVLLNQSPTIESPLITVARSAAQTWLEILCLSPDAMLDLLPAEQEAVIELLCWACGSASMTINLLKRAGLKIDRSGSLLVQKIGQFKSEFSSTQLPQDAVLLSWLKIRPPDLDSSYIILLLDEISVTVKKWWLQQLSPLISTLFLNGIVVKAISSSRNPALLPLSSIQLNWSDAQLKSSINSQFDSAMDKIKQKEMGQIVDFRSLFGSDPAIGYVETEEKTTDALISASHNSLARMLTIGNRLLQYHCEHRTKDGAPEKYLYTEDLQAILNSA